MVSGEFPRRVVIGSDPIPRTALWDEIDKVRAALWTDLRAQIIERGWDPADVEVTLHIPEFDALLFERNQYRMVAEARWLPRERPAQPEGEPVMTQPLILTFYRSGLARRYRWRLVRRENGEKIAREAQGRGFSRIADCEDNAGLTLVGDSEEAAFADDFANDRRVLVGRPDVEIRYE